MTKFYTDPAFTSVLLINLDLRQKSCLGPIYLWNKIHQNRLSGLVMKA